MRRIRLFEYSKFFSLVSFAGYNSAQVLNYDTGSLLCRPCCPHRTARIANEFKDFLESKGNKELITVLGNHDIDDHGIHWPIFSKKHLLAHYTGGYPKIITDDEIKVLFLLFNSNFNPKPKDAGATGEIGNKQMSDMGNKLGKLKRTKTLGDYTLIAVLHHHVVKFLPKDYDDQNWIKNILYMKIHSA